MLNKNLLAWKLRLRWVQKVPRSVLIRNDTATVTDELGRLPQQRYLYGVTKDILPPV